jgi:DNA ligase 1
MRPFAELLDRLSYTPGRNEKLRLLENYFRQTPDPDRGWALAALTDALPFSFPVRRILTELVTAHIDAELYRLSRDYVGDTAETVALLWPGNERVAEDQRNDVSLSVIVEKLMLVDRRQLGRELADWLDKLDVTGRWALLKLLTGGLRIGVSARLAKLALANAWDQPVEDIEEIWHALSPPFPELFDWLNGKAGRPDVAGLPVFRPMMLAHPLEDADREKLDLDAFAIEWKWDGMRVQVSSRSDAVRVYSRTGDEISAAFPELLKEAYGDVTLDGELLVVRDGEVAPFNDLQQRLNRKTVSRRQIQMYPVHLRAYDILEHAGEDLRGAPLVERRARLEGWFAGARLMHCDLSALLNGITSLPELETIWASTRACGIEGLMLKRKHSPYMQGRPKGHWYKWKRAPLTADCVLMYAQRGSGRRSSYYSDYTFGVWREAGEQLVPVGKAYSGFTDEELRRLDRWIRSNTRETFGPVRAVVPELVLEVAFDAVQPSSRHKSGIAMRFPRIHRIRWDKPAAEADCLETLAALAGSQKRHQIDIG